MSISPPLDMAMSVQLTLKQIYEFKEAHSKHTFADLARTPAMHFNHFFAPLFGLPLLPDESDPSHSVDTIKWALGHTKRHKGFIVQRILKYFWARKKLRQFLREVVHKRRHRVRAALSAWEAHEMARDKAGEPRPVGGSRRNEAQLSGRHIKADRVPRKKKLEVIAYLHRKKLLEVCGEMQSWIEHRVRMKHELKQLSGQLASLWLRGSFQSCEVTTLATRFVGLRKRVLGLDGFHAASMHWQRVTPQDLEDLYEWLHPPQAPKAEEGPDATDALEASTGGSCRSPPPDIQVNGFEFHLVTKPRYYKEDVHDSLEVKGVVDHVHRMHHLLKHRAGVWDGGGTARPVRQRSFMFGGEEVGDDAADVPGVSPRAAGGLTLVLPPAVKSYEGTIEERHHARGLTPRHGAGDGPDRPPGDAPLVVSEVCEGPSDAVERPPSGEAPSPRLRCALSDFGDEAFFVECTVVPSAEEGATPDGPGAGGAAAGEDSDAPEAPRPTPSPRASSAEGGGPAPKPSLRGSSHLMAWAVPRVTCRKLSICPERASHADTPDPDTPKPRGAHRAGPAREARKSCGHAGPMPAPTPVKGRGRSLSRPTPLTMEPTAVPGPGPLPSPSAQATGAVPVLRLSSTPTDSPKVGCHTPTPKPVRSLGPVQTASPLHPRGTTQTSAEQSPCLAQGGPGDPLRGAVPGTPRSDGGLSPGPAAPCGVSLGRIRPLKPQLSSTAPEALWPHPLGEPRQEHPEPKARLLSGTPGHGSGGTTGPTNRIHLPRARPYGDAMPHGPDAGGPDAEGPDAGRPDVARALETPDALIPDAAAPDPGASDPTSGAAEGPRGNTDAGPGGSDAAGRRGASKRGSTGSESGGPTAESSGAASRTPGPAAVKTSGAETKSEVRESNCRAMATICSWTATEAPAAPAPDSACGAGGAPAKAGRIAAAAGTRLRAKSAATESKPRGDLCGGVSPKSYSWTGNALRSEGPARGTEAQSGTADLKSHFCEFGARSPMLRQSWTHGEAPDAGRASLPPNSRLAACPKSTHRRTEKARAAQGPLRREYTLGELCP